LCIRGVGTARRFNCLCGSAGNEIPSGLIIALTWGSAQQLSWGSAREAEPEVVTLLFS